MESDRRAPDAAVTGAVLAIALAAALLAVAAPPNPTGRAIADGLIVGGAVGVVTLLAARAPWWAVAVLTGAALCIAVDPILMVLGVLALAGALFAGNTSRPHPLLLAAAAGVALNVAARAELDVGLGVSAAITIGAGALVFVTGLRRCSRLVRRLTWGGLAVVVIAAAAATAGFGYAAAKSRSELAAGLRWAESAVDALEHGDFSRAADEFGYAADSLEVAHAELTEAYGSAAAFVPIVAQHRTASVDMSAAGAIGAEVVARAVDDIDVDALRVSGGRIDLAALAALGEPFQRVHAALEDLGRTAQAVDSPWLVPRARYELDDFESSVAEHLPSLDDAIDAVELAPGMLGADGPQRYLALFTTPAESRGLGGFVGNYAELTVDDGQLGLSRFGRAQQLDAAVAEADLRLDGPEGFLRRYGRFGFADDDGTVGDAAFRNLTMTPHFPWAAEVAADLYGQVTGREVDGVIAIDPYVVAALLRYTGPIQLAALDVELTADNAAAYLLRDQYVLAEGDTSRRVDALAEAARLTFDALLAGTLPEPTTLADDLGPLAREGRLLVWTPDAAEQDLISRVGMAGEMPTLQGRDGWSFALTNGGGNKIDAFLERAASYDATTDPDTGETSATLRIDLSNTAPAEGLPKYVIGNRVGLPPGTNRLYVSVYSALGLRAMTVDGEAVGVEHDEERDWNVYSRYVEIPPGGTAHVEVTLDGTVDRPGDVVTWTQPMSDSFTAGTGD